ncbi:MAG TPA: helix-turn-helix domain-containing protein [Solirubrobacterales bacterium]|nr:helix-turn-helix domain-containing protein [Solirubrobacterales bacterium]
MAKQRTVTLTDPRALRAMAHPTRLELIGLLRRGGPLTATQAGEQLGESPASCSFHLRQLAKYGLVEEAGGGRGRERPWQATAISTEWPVFGDSEETRAAGEMLSRVVVERYFENAMEWLERQPGEPPEWAEAALFGDALVYMTVEELREVEARIRDLFEPFLERLEDKAPRKEGSRPVSVIALAFPLAEPGREV